MSLQGEALRAQRAHRSPKPTETKEERERRLKQARAGRGGGGRKLAQEDRPLLAPRGGGPLNSSPPAKACKILKEGPPRRPRAALAFSPPLGTPPPQQPLVAAVSLAVIA